VLRTPEGNQELKGDPANHTPATSGGEVSGSIV
jgi:hypothetical protein